MIDVQFPRPRPGGPVSLAVRATLLAVTVAALVLAGGEGSLDMAAGEAAHEHTFEARTAVVWADALAKEQTFPPASPAALVERSLAWMTPSEPVAAVESPPACTSAPMPGFAEALFHAINRERASYGVPALAEDPCLTDVALLRSTDMAAGSYFAHISPNGDTAFSTLEAAGLPYGWAGENLARNNYSDADTVAVAIQDLMASEAHRTNMLSLYYTSLGVGLVTDGEGMRYYTMIFVGPR